MTIEYVSFQKHGDERGMLISLEENKEVPFCVKRVYYLIDTKKGVKRGFHAHKKLKQVLVCVSGSCKLLLDDGVEKKIVTLNNPSVGILIRNNIWREMFDFSKEAVLLVLASELYDENDYIRNYDDFLEYVKNERSI